MADAINYKYYSSLLSNYEFFISAKAQGLGYQHLAIYCFPAFDGNSANGSAQRQTVYFLFS